MTGSDPADTNMVGPTKWNQAHTSPDIADVTGLTAALAGKSDTSHTHSGLAPTGGSTGQVLKKNSATNYDYAWASDSTGSAEPFREFGLIQGGAVTFTNLAAGFAEASGQQSRTRVDLTNFTDFRLLFVMSVAATTGDLKLQYSTSSGWGSPVDLIQSDNPAANVLIETAWTAIPAGAKADVYLRIGMLNGNGTEDPAVRWAKLQVR